MNRHVHPSRSVPVSMAHHLHKDTLGVAPFGPWTTENIFYWFVRLFALTSANDPLNSVKINEDTLRLSLAIFNAKRKVIGAAINVTVPNEEVPMRQWIKFIFGGGIGAREPDHEPHLYPGAYCHAGLGTSISRPSKGKGTRHGGHAFFGGPISRAAQGPYLRIGGSLGGTPSKQGSEYMVVTATNQWTGAACEVLGATRVHFAPFRDREGWPGRPLPPRRSPFPTMATWPRKIAVCSSMS